MPDLTPDVTTTPNFDPGRVAIMSGWLVYDVGYHTCGGYGPESGYAHDSGRGGDVMKALLVALVGVVLTLAVVAPLSGAFVAACGLLILLVPLHHLAGAVR